MSVVQRCPNCGTTQTTSGECEACHEAQVRYFCTNHDGGAWLSGPTCPRCEARSIPAARPPPLPARARPAPRASDAPVVVRDRPLPVEEEEYEVPASPPAFWGKLLRGALVARPSPSPDDRRGGWLMRLVFRLALIAAILVAVLGVAIYMFVRSLH